MSKTKTVRQKLKKLAVWKEYCRRFNHAQMRLIFTKTALIFDPGLSVDFCLAGERALLETPVGPNMFLAAFAKLAQVIPGQINWQAWSYFLWHVYQMSTFYRDRRQNQPNIYSAKTYLTANRQKRRHYADWLDSLDCYSPGYNQQVRAVLKELT